MDEGSGQTEVSNLIKVSVSVFAQRDIEFCKSALFRDDDFLRWLRVKPLL